MKIKMDFVSNSSSTSFIYISNQTFDKKTFFEAIGVEQDSPISELFDSMFQELDSAIASGTRVTAVDEVIEDPKYADFTPEVLGKVAAALKDGKSVVRGTLSSEASMAESLLCVEIFEIDTEKMFLNAYPNYW